MKRYIIKRLHRDRSKPDCLFEISKSGKVDGKSMSFLNDGRKNWQHKCKNDLLIGAVKTWCWDNPKNDVFINWNKGKTRGIKISFK